VSEAKLLAEFQATDAWIGRVEIVESLRSAGHPASLTVLADVQPN
jgi:hypothetical protein